jgi:hypothetical protein
MAKAQTAAGKPENDLYLRWDSIAQNLQSQASYIANDRENNMHQSVRIAADSVHTRAMSTFTFWRGAGTWQLLPLTVVH